MASHLVKVEPQNEAWWINLAYALRRSEGIEQGGSNSTKGASHTPQLPYCIQPGLLREYTGRIEEAKARLRHAIELDKDIRGLALDD